MTAPKLMKGLILTVLALTLWGAWGVVKAEELVELKFQFSTPYVATNGDKDPSNDVKYATMSIFTPPNPTSRVWLIGGELGPWSMEGSCRKDGGRLTCNLVHPFVTFIIQVHRDPDQLWAEINSPSGLFGNNAYNLMGQIP